LFAVNEKLRTDEEKDILRSHTEAGDDPCHLPDGKHVKAESSKSEPSDDCHNGKEPSDNCRNRKYEY